MSETKKNILSSYLNKASKTLQDSDRVNSLLENAKKKLSDVSEDTGKMGEFVDIIKTFGSMVKDSFSGNNKFSWQTLLLITAGLIYFITPVDLIPDFIPVLGFTDDISVVFFIYQRLKEDIDNYRNEASERSY